MKAKPLARLATLEGEAAAHTDAAQIITAAAARPPRTRAAIGELLIDLLAAKLEASRAVATAAAAAMQNPAWLARQDAAGIEALGAYLDSSAFALGDRLAAQSTEARNEPQQ